MSISVMFKIIKMIKIYLFQSYVHIVLGSYNFDGDAHILLFKMGTY